MLKELPCPWQPGNQGEASFLKSSMTHLCRWEPLGKFPAAEGEELWPLCKCSECGLVRLGRIPAVHRAYPSEYYGKKEKKFLTFFEYLSHQPPVLLKDAERLAQRLAVKDGQTPRVLDVGCGRGYLLSRLAHAGFRCAGIDIPGSPIPNHANGMDIRIGDALNLPWPDQSFDLLVMNHVLEHVMDPWIACREASRVLRKGGILYLGVPNFGSFQSKLFGSTWFPLEIPRHLFHFTPTTLLAVVSSVGFFARRTSTWSLTQGTFGFIQSALNRIDPQYKNAFLDLIKGQKSAPRGRLVFHALLACLLLPLGVLETIISSLLGRGPIIAISAAKSSAH